MPRFPYFVAGLSTPRIAIERFRNGDLPAAGSQVGDKSYGLFSLDRPFAVSPSQLVFRRALQSPSPTDLASDFSCLCFAGFRVVFTHVGFRMPEDGLSVFQPEFLPHGICVRVSQLVRYPAFDNGLVVGLSSSSQEGSNTFQSIENRRINQFVRARMFEDSSNPAHASLMVPRHQPDSTIFALTALSAYGPKSFAGSMP